MRINVYSQELTDEVVLVEKRSNTGIVYHAAQLILHSSPMPGFDGYFANEDGEIRGRSGKHIGGAITAHGYRRVCMRTSGGRWVNTLVHRAVASAWIENSAGKPLINHKNRIRTDNRVANLEWCTARENVVHSVRNGGGAAGERQGLSKLKEAQIPEIRTRLAGGESPTIVAEDYGVSPRAITLLRDGVTWKGVPQHD